MKISISLAATAVVATVALSGCSSSSSGTAGHQPPKIAAASSLGQGEGKLNIIVWAGYAEDGSNDKTVDWVHPFEQQTGCQVNAKVADTSDAMVQLMRTGQYDGVSASGDATLRLIYAGDVAPVNTDLVPNYKTVSSFLKDRSWNSVNNQMYGIPHGWGANVLMWNKSVVKTAPTSWSDVFAKNSPYAGKITAYDSRFTSPTPLCTCPRRSRRWASLTPTRSPRTSSPPRSTCSSSRTRTSASTGRRTRPR